MDLTQSDHECPECNEHNSFDEYGGLCGRCWVELTREQRATLRGYSEGAPLTVLLLWTWRIVITASVVLIGRKMFW